MKQFLLVSSLLLSAACLPCAFAEEAAATPPTGDAEPVFIQGDLSNVISEYARSHIDILNSNKCAFFTGIANIATPAGEEGYADARSTAYAEAFLQARQSFASKLETEIASAMKRIAEQGVGLGEADNALQQSINDEMIKILKEKAAADGIDANDPEAFKAYVQKNVQNTSSFQQQIAASGNSFQQGLIAYKTFATPTQVGVLAVYNQRNLNAAKALRSGNSNGLRGEAKIPLLSQVPKDAKTLANTFGCRILRNEKGEYCIVGYGHGAAEDDDPDSIGFARAEAELNAMNEIKMFAGEQIVFSRELRNASAGGKIRGGKSLAKNTKQFKMMAEQEASSLKINGMSSLCAYTIKLPSNDIIVVNVMAWVPDEAAKAKMIAGEMLVGKDDKNQGISAQSSSGSAAPKSVPAQTSRRNLVAVPTTGESDVSDLD